MFRERRVRHSQTAGRQALLNQTEETGQFNLPHLQENPGANKINRPGLQSADADACFSP